MSCKSLLIEFVVEELPPQSLLTVEKKFVDSLLKSLKPYLLKSSKSDSFISYKRFGILIEGIELEPNIIKKIKGPSYHNIDSDFHPALVGFCRKYNIKSVSELEKSEDGYYYFNHNQHMVNFNQYLTDSLLLALKTMANNLNFSWQGYQFIRPIHNLVVMIDQQVLPINIWGHQSSDYSLIGKELNNKNLIDDRKVHINNAESYFDIMSDYGIYPRFEERKQNIIDKVKEYSKNLHLGLIAPRSSSLDDEDKGSLIPVEVLINEVTSLVESPQILIGEFDKKFLKLPQAVPIVTMAKHQRYFALCDNHRLANQFIIVADIIKSQHNCNDKDIIKDNQRVLTARLVDAKFFYDQDLAVIKTGNMLDQEACLRYSINSESRLKQKQEFFKLLKEIENIPFFKYYNDKLKKQIYSKKLQDKASQWHRVQRIETVISKIADIAYMGQDTTEVIDNIKKLKAIAILSKFDLATKMVAEFPELQGDIAAKYWIDYMHIHYGGIDPNDDNEIPKHVLSIFKALIYQYQLIPHIREDYHPTPLANKLILANNLEHIFSMWLVGNIPNSSKDPYGVRRAALNIIGVLIVDNDFKDVGLATIWQHLGNSDLLKQYDIDETKYWNLVKEMNVFILQRYKQILLDSGLMSSNNILDKISLYNYGNLQFRLYDDIQDKLCAIKTDKYYQLIKRINNLISNKIDFTEKCQQLIKEFEDNFYSKEGHTIFADSLSILYKNQDKYRKYLQDYNQNMPLSKTISSLFSQLVNIDLNHFKEKFWFFLENLIDLTNNFLDEFMVFDRDNSEYYQALLILSYTTLVIFYCD